jgi:hypothetical protein
LVVVGGANGIEFFFGLVVLIQVFAQVLIVASCCFYLFCARVLFATGYGLV